MRPGLIITTAVIVCICLVSELTADDSSLTQLPFPLLDLGTEGSSYAFVVNKAQSRLDVYRQVAGGSIVLVRSFRASTGTNGGDKVQEGDERTPEGIYYFVRIREDNELLPKYGLRAFDMNYPNRIDRIEGKNGHGIWLHATDEPERLNEPRTTLGCVVVSNDDIRAISDYITLYRTPIVISESFEFAPVTDLKVERDRVEEFVRRWLGAWSNQNYKNYADCYSATFRGSRSRRDAWLGRKRSVFAATGWATVDIADLKILRTRTEYVVSFYQRYRSNLMDDTGIKWVYLLNENGELRIIDEEWHPVSKALSGRRWGERRPNLSDVLNDLNEIGLQSGKLAIVHPQLSLVPEQKAEPVKEIVTGGASVGVSDLNINVEGEKRVQFELKLSNQLESGERLRGWLFVLAQWEEPSAVTSFPRDSAVDGRTPEPSRGDSFGIRWFKIVRGTLERPSADARLTGIRCIAYRRDGKLLLDELLPVQLP